MKADNPDKEQYLSDIEDRSTDANMEESSLSSVNHNLGMSKSNSLRGGSGTAKAKLAGIQHELNIVQAKYKYLFDSIPVGMVTTDVNGVICEVNQKMAGLLGSDKHRLTGLNIVRCILSDSINTFYAHMKNVTSEDTWRSCDLEMKRVDGSTFKARLDTTVLPDFKKSPGRYQMLITDITGNKQDSYISVPSELSRCANDALIVTDRNLSILTWNKSAETLFGWKEEEVKGEAISQGVREIIFSFLYNNQVMEKLQAKGSWIGKCTVLKKDNTQFFTHAYINMLWDAEGKFNGIMAVHQQEDVEISEETMPDSVEEEIRRKVEDQTAELLETNRILLQEIMQHKKAEMAAYESAGKNRDLVDNIKLGVFRSTPGVKARFLEVNMAMEDITGYSRDELLKMNVCDLYADTPKRNPLTDDIELSSWNVTRELCLRKKNGDLIMVGANLMTIRYDSGKILYVDGILEDISERKEAQQQVQQSLERLQKTIKEIIQAMAYIEEVRDPYTAGHQRRVSKLSYEIARMIGLREDQFEGIRMAAFVHDIGKIQVPADILSKPGNLTRAEFDLIKDHARTGYEILKNIEFPWPIARIVLQHHERLNGSGYPSGLNSKQIIIEAKVLAVADVVEAMSSHRPYRPALGIENALAEIHNNKGILYDPDTVDACIKLFTSNGFNLN